MGASRAGTAAPTGRIAGLDCLRGVAVSLVLIRHGFLPPNADGIGGASGEIGVAMFFALSGYLITGLLLSDIARFGRVQYGRFYRNRVLRLYPALLVFIAFAVVVSLTSDAAGDQGILGETVAAALTYTTNLPITDTSPATTHLWTLATEEQFYVAWPIVLVIGVRLRRLRLVVVLVALALVLVLIGTMVLTEPNVARVYRFPTSWASTMLIGAAARVGEPRLAAFLDRVGRGRASLSGAGVLLLLCLLPEDKGSWHTYLLVGPAAAIATIAVIFRCGNQQSLSSPMWWPAQALGRISYGAYLWNYGIVVWLGGLGLSWELALLSVPLTILAAAASWFAVEEPFLRWKSILDLRARGSTREAAREPHPRESEDPGPHR